MPVSPTGFRGRKTGAGAVQRCKQRRQPPPQPAPCTRTYVEQTALAGALDQDGGQQRNEQHRRRVQLHRAHRHAQGRGGQAKQGGEVGGEAACHRRRRQRDLQAHVPGDRPGGTQANPGWFRKQCSVRRRAWSMRRAGTGRMAPHAQSQSANTAACQFLPAFMPALTRPPAPQR